MNRTIKNACVLAAVAFTLCTDVFAAVPGDWTGATHDLATDGALTISSDGSYWVTGSGATITVGPNVTCTIVLDTVTITPSTGSPFTIGAGSTVHLTVVGFSTLTAQEGWAGIVLDASGAALIVDGGNGTLKATGGDARPGIFLPDGSSFTLDAANATVKATAGKNKKASVNDSKSTSAAGLGSYGAFDSGTVTVNAGLLEAKGGTEGAGIGVGSVDQSDGATCGDVTVNGGTVVATTVNWGCGIGGATPYWKAGGNLKSYTQTGGDVTAIGMNCAGVGGGSGGGNANSTTGNYGGYVKGRILITGGRLYATSTNNATIISAAIGGSGCRHSTYINPDSTSGGEILIEGGTVIALGDKIGIGSGGTTRESPQSLRGGNTTVKITGGTVYASGSMWSIGGPEQADSAVTNLASVTITGGYLQTQGGGLQIQPTNGESHGNRPVYAAPCYATDQSPTYVRAYEGSQTYEYPTSPTVETAPSGSGTWPSYPQKWLPVGGHRVLDSTNREIYMDVSTAEEGTTYDPVLFRILRLTGASRNATVSGTFNVLESNDRHDSYIFVMDKQSVKLTLHDATVVNSNSVVAISSGASLLLNLAGVNAVTSLSKNSGSQHSAIRVNAKGALTIEGTGSITAKSYDYAAAIGEGLNSNCGSITINSGTVTAYGGQQGAGIGCAVSGNGAGTCGAVTVNGGTVRAYGFHLTSAGKVSTSSGYAAGIGGATGYSCNGGCLKSYTQTGGDVEAYGETGAGIGAGGGGSKYSGYNGGSCGPVTISGGRLVADSRTYGLSSGYCCAAGIGGAGVRYKSDTTPGKAGALVSYTQTGGDVTVAGTRVAIGGGGQNYGATKFGGFIETNMTVTISGGTLTVLPCTDPACSIGGQEFAAYQSATPEQPESANLKSFTITGGSVKMADNPQIAPSNTLGAAVYRADIAIQKVANGVSPVNVTFPVANGSYTYSYNGAGHVDDPMLHFWLPNGLYPGIGQTGGEMVDGEWHRYAGLRMIIR